MSSWDVYWITQLDALRHSAVIALVIFGIISFVLIICWIAETCAEDKDKTEGLDKVLCKFAKLSSFLFFCVFFIYTFLPTTKQMAIVVIAPRIATVENIDAISAESREMLRLGKQWLIERSGIKSKDKGNKE